MFELCIYLYIYSIVIHPSLFLEANSEVKGAMYCTCNGGNYWCCGHIEAWQPHAHNATCRHRAQQLHSVQHSNPIYSGVSLITSQAWPDLPLGREVELQACLGFVLPPLYRAPYQIAVFFIWLVTLPQNKSQISLQPDLPVLTEGRATPNYLITTPVFLEKNQPGNEDSPIHNL